MIKFIQESFKGALGFFVKEKAYAVLLLLSIATFCFYVVMLEPYTEGSSPALEKFREVEMLQKQEDGEKKILALIEKDTTTKLITYVFNYFVLALFFAGIAINIAVFLKWRAKETIITPLYDKTDTVWSLDDVAKFLIVLFSVMLVMNVGARYVLLYCGLDEPETSYLIVHGSIIDLAALLLILYYAIWQHKASLQEIGLKSRAWLKDIWIGVLTYSWLLPLFFLLVIGISFIAKLFNYEPPPHALFDVLMVEDKRNPFIVAYSIFLACALGPVVEELFFRGFLYDAIRKKWGALSAILLSAGLFAYVHESWFAFVPIFFLGVVLAYLRERRGTLIPSITMHIIHNTVLLTYFFIIKRAVLDNM